ncbi:MAG: hypothetical protein ACI9U2_001279 [Bradymonadia bacterium]|jgi:hypothetical protein
MLASILILTLAAPPATPRVHTPPPRFTGAFRGVEAGYGGAFGAADGHALSLTARAASVLYLADVAVSYRPVLRTTTAHHLGVAARLHPFFLFLLANNPWGATIGGFYLEVGVGGVLQDDAGAATWQWGAGIDVPLVGHLDQNGLWLGAEMIRICSFTDTATADGAEQGGVTVVSLRLGWRFNGL